MEDMLWWGLYQEVEKRFSLIFDIWLTRSQYLVDRELCQLEWQGASILFTGSQHGEEQVL